MRIKDLADLMGKSVDEIKAMLEQNEVIELKLTEKKTKENIENGRIEYLK